MTLLYFIAGENFDIYIPFSSFLFSNEYCIAMIAQSAEIILVNNVRSDESSK